MKNDFDNIIKSKLNKTTIPPSNDLWDKIEAELDKKEDNKLIVIPFWNTPLFKQAIAASIIFLLGGVSSFLIQNNSSETQISSNDNNILNINKTNTFSNDNSQKNYNSQLSNTQLKINKQNNTFAKNNTNSNTKTGVLNTQKNSKIILAHNVKSINNTKQNSLQKFSTNITNYKNSTKVTDYKWILDPETNAYQVVLKDGYSTNEYSISSPKLTAFNSNLFKKQNINTQSLMSLTQEDFEKEESPERIDITTEDDSYKQFKTRRQKLNYKGFIIGPSLSYKSIFTTKNHYVGASFGFDFAYDFGGSIGLQSGISYAINKKLIQIANKDGNIETFKSDFSSINIPLVFRYKFTKLSRKLSKPLSFNLIAGLEYSYLDHQYLHQLGLTAGVEYDYFLQADMMLTFGVRGGLYNNLNRNEVQIKEELSAFNYNLNAYISLRFIDWLKKTKN